MNKKRIIYASVVALIAVAGIVFFLTKDSNSSYIFDTVKVARGTISNTVTATGTLEATETIDVGCQVSGVIETLYVDYNSIVKKGQLIAELDKSTLLSTLKTAEAQLEEAEADYEYQGKNLKRMKTLFDQNVLAESEYDQAVYTYKLSKAALKSGEASVEKANRNLGYASIYSPIDGIVKDVKVEEGNTVTAGYSTPELFIITNDLSEMQVEADIDEADIGQIKMDQRVEFTVDAFSDDTFTGKISEIHLEPTEESNVITYTVIILVQNPDKKLKPGMTASITAYVQEAENVLLASGKGVRFTPDREMMKEYMSSLPDNQKMGHSNGRKARGTGMRSSTSGERQRPAAMAEEDDSHKTFWIKEGEIIKPVQVEIGISDGSQIEILSGLKEGQEVVVSMEKGKAEETTEVEEEKESNPFAPTRPGRGKK